MMPALALPLQSAAVISLSLPVSAHTTFETLSICVDDVALWFLDDGLLLNRNKTEAILFGTSAQRKKIPTAT